MTVTTTTPTTGTTVNINSQRFWAVIRQLAAFAALVFSALTQALNGIKMPIGWSIAMAVFGSLILGIEHYVADPSTGSTSTTTGTTTTTVIPPI